MKFSTSAVTSIIPLSELKPVLTNAPFFQNRGDALTKARSKGRGETNGGVSTGTKERFEGMQCKTAN